MAWPFIWTIQNSLYPRMICTKFDWNWPPGSGEDFFYISISEYGFSLLWPLRLTGIMIWRRKNLNLHYIRNLSCKYDVLWLSGSWEDFYMTPTPLLHFCNYFPFEEDLALYLNNLEFPLPEDNLYQVWFKLASWFWRRFFFNINTCKYGFPYCVPTRPPGTMMWTILNQHYIRKLLSKWPILAQWFWRKIIIWPPPQFCIFVIISALKKTWPFIWTIYNFLYPRMICTKFDWNWPAVLEKVFFSIYGFS
jgi:hypothetical protein